MVDFETIEDVIRHFECDGDVLDTETGMVMIADCNGDGEFFGVMVAEVPEEYRGKIFDAVEYAIETFPAPATGAPDRMVFMEVPGFLFDEIAETILEHPERFVSRSYRN